MIERAERQDAERVSGVPNLTFDLIALLHNKLEAIAASGLYLDDAELAGNDRAHAIFLQSRMTDLAVVRAVRRLLRDELEKTVPGFVAPVINNERGGDLTPAGDLEEVDLESFLSFPASDPPSFSGTTEDH